MMHKMHKILNKRQEEEEMMFEERMDKFKITKIDIDLIRSSLSKKLIANSSKCGKDDNIIQEILMKKCSPGSKEWWKTLGRFRNLENLNELERNYVPVRR